MQNLIDQTFFVGDIVVPNTDRPEVIEKLNSFIEKYQKDFLIKLLGVRLYYTFEQELAVTEEEVTPARAQFLLHGGEFAYSADPLATIRWEGLVPENTKRSIIANYVYYFYILDSIVHNTGVGVAVQKGENAVPVSPQTKIVNAWNYNAEQIIHLVNFLLYSVDGLEPVSYVYSEFLNIDAARALRTFRKILW